MSLLFAGGDVCFLWGSPIFALLMVVKQRMLVLSLLVCQGDKLFINIDYPYLLYACANSKVTD